MAFSDLNFDGVAAVSDILQEAHYYPHGLGFSGMTTMSNGVPSRYTFNGKEAQEAFGLGWLDFGARMYDAQVGRWMAVDGLAELFPGWSGYKFGMSNPIMYFDSDGQIEIPLRATRLYNSHKLQRSTSGFKIKTKAGYVDASSQTVKAIPSIGHKHQTYNYAYVSTGDNTMSAADKKAAKEGMLATINSGFFKSRTTGTSPHIGVDLKAAIGTDVYSFGDGKVLETGYSDGTGNFLVVEYGNGDKVRFMHLSEISVSKGEQIYEGQIIAETGNSGYMKKGVHYPPHLHIDAANSEGMMVDPLERTYGRFSNEQFFNEYDGDYRSILATGIKPSKQVSRPVTLFIPSMGTVHPDKTGTFSTNLVERQ